MAREDIVKDLKKDGFVKAITGSIRKAFDNIPDQMRSGFDRVSSTVAQNTSEIMGSALNNMISDFKNLASGAKDMLMGGWNALFGGGEDSHKKDSLKEQKEQTSVLKNILNFFISKDKLDRVKAKAGKAKDGLLDGLGGAMLLAGTLVGGAVGLIMVPLMGILKSFLIPFEVVGMAMAKLLSLGKWLDTKIFGVFKWFKSTKLFTSLKGMVDVAKTSFFTPIANFFKKLIGIGKSVMGFVMKIPILGKFFAGFARGFGFIMRGVPVIGWTITAIMGVIDFFTAFNSTQGTMYEKIKAGITGMLTGFFDPVFELVGWLADKFLGMFGINVEGGVASKLKEGYESLVSGIFSFGEGFVNFFTEFITNLTTRFSEAWGQIKESGSGIVESIKSFFSNFITSMKDLILGFLPNMEDIKNHVTNMAKEYLPDWVYDMLENDAKKLQEGVGFFDKFNLFKDDKPVPIAAANEEKQRVENTKAKETYDASKQMIDEMQKTRKAVEEQKAIASNTSNVAIQQNNNTQRAQRPSDFREAPDEIENFGMIFMNKTTLGGSGW